MSWLKPELFKNTSSSPKKKPLIKRLVSTVKKKLFLLRRRHPTPQLLAGGTGRHVPDPPLLCRRCSCHQFSSLSEESGEGNIGGDDDDEQVDESAEQFIGKMRAMWRLERKISDEFWAQLRDLDR
ncbi:unnamed protein product [Linum trigynum]|uniref:Uncharacterized protein n=1 Tax=Linum trigynum TaxID=586398 RepID=A0AAV2CCK7_9ROSI